MPAGNIKRNKKREQLILFFYFASEIIPGRFIFFLTFLLWKEIPYRSDWGRARWGEFNQKGFFRVLSFQNKNNISKPNLVRSDEKPPGGLFVGFTYINF
jgi:hypothetical protein